MRKCKFQMDCHSYGIEAKRKSQIQDLYSQLLNEKAVEKRLRFKPDMEVTIKGGASHRERSSGIVIKHELKSVFIKTEDGEELCIRPDELDQVLPDNPGDKPNFLLTLMMTIVLRFLPM